MAAELTDEGAEAVSGWTGDADDLANLVAVVHQHVHDYAPNAPAALRKEAAARFGGYLLLSAGRAMYGLVRGDSLDLRSAEYVTNHAVAWRNCGGDFFNAVIAQLEATDH